MASLTLLYTLQGLDSIAGRTLGFLQVLGMQCQYA